MSIAPEIILKSTPDWAQEARVVTEALDAGSRDGLNETMEALKAKALRLAARRVRKFTGTYHSSFRIVRARKRGNKTSAKLINDAPEAAVIETGRPPNSTPMPYEVMYDYMSRTGLLGTSFSQPTRVTVKKKDGGTYTRVQNKKISTEQRVRQAIRKNAAQGGSNKLGKRGQGAWIFRDIKKEFDKSQFRQTLIEKQTMELRKRGRIRK